MRPITILTLAVLASGCASAGPSDAGHATPARLEPVRTLAPVRLADIETADSAPRRPSGWRRGHGSLRVALQAGHWRAAEAPSEQAHLRANGTHGGGLAEWEVNLGIAKRTAALLAGQGYLVEVLPTTIPPGYRADLFIAIHADGSSSSEVSGFRAAAPRVDETGRAAAFASLLEQRYAEATGLLRYPLITRRMVGYYAFNSGAYQHALHPSTVGVILETGFITSPRDRAIVVDAQDRAAAGIAAAVNQYFEPMPLDPRPIPQAE
jgi:hypothetical protein